MRLNAVQAELFLELLTDEVLRLRQNPGVNARLDAMDIAHNFKNREGATVDPAFERWVESEQARHAATEGKRGLSDLLQTDVNEAKTLTDATFDPKKDFHP